MRVVTSTSQGVPANAVTSRLAAQTANALSAIFTISERFGRGRKMPLDALQDWCASLERDLSPEARLAHWIGHEPDPWQIEAFSTRSLEVALRVGRQSGKTSVLAARALEELHVPESLTICIAPAERQAKIIAREVSRQLQRTDLVVTRSWTTASTSEERSRYSLSRLFNLNFERSGLLLVFTPTSKTEDRSKNSA